MPAAAALRTYLLPHLGLSNAGGLSTSQTTAILNAANQALQEIYRARRQVEAQSLQVLPARTVTLGQVTQYSKTITFAGFDAATMLGCTILISGDPLQNSLELTTSSVTLRAPYQGPTGANVTATVYGDRLTLPGDIAALYPPARLNDQYELHPLEASQTIPAHSPLKNAQRPQFYTLEDSVRYNTTPGLALIFDTLPDAPYVLNFTAELRAPRLADLSDTRDYLIPGQQDETILFPWVRYHLRTYPNFLPGPGGLAEIKESYTRAAQQWATLPKGLLRTQLDTTSW